MGGTQRFPRKGEGRLSSTGSGAEKDLERNVKTTVAVEGELIL